MNKGWFVTGTDTSVGKTRVAQALVAGLAQRGLRVAGMKPVASGCRPTPAGLRSEDAEALMQSANVPADYADVNPYVFASAVSPNLAAQKMGVEIELDVVRAHFSRLSQASDCVVVEGAGGWLTPISERHTMADVALTLALPVVLVVGMRLGCLNHALLSRAAIDRAGATFAGWVANTVGTTMPQFDENLAVLSSRFGVSALAVLPHAPDGVAASFIRQLARNVS